MTDTTPATQKIVVPSPTGRYEVRATPWVPRDVHMVWPPELHDLQEGQLIYTPADAGWSLENALWETDHVVRLDLRLYPESQQALVTIDCAARTARFHDSKARPLADLDATLAQVWEERMRRRER